MSLNKVHLIGNVGVKPEVRNIQGRHVANFSIATSESYKDRITGEKKEITEWHRVVCWNSLADVCGKYLNKGSKVYVEGKLRTRSYEDTTGTKRYSTEIIASSLIMLGTSPTPSDSPVVESSGHTEETNSDDLPF